MRIRLWPIVLSWPISVFLLILSSLVFARNQGLVTPAQWLGTFIDSYQHITRSIIVAVFEWLPIDGFEITQPESDYLWILYAFWTPALLSLLPLLRPLIDTKKLRNLRDHMRGLLLSLYALFATVVIVWLVAENHVQIFEENTVGSAPDNPYWPYNNLVAVLLYGFVGSAVRTNASDKYVIRLKGFLQFLSNYAAAGFAIWSLHLTGAWRV